MANSKTGFIYFNLDTDRYQDIKIKRLKKDFSCAGIAIYDYILCEIYRVKGCFIEWDESTAFDVSEYFGIKESLVMEVVNYCCGVGLFNKGLLTNGGILTSLSIQKRYIEMCKRAKRADCEIPKHVKIPEECAKLTEKNIILTEESTKLPETNLDLNKVSKVEKSRVKKSREENIVVGKSDLAKDSFEIFRKVYPGTKRGLDVEYENFIKKNKPEIVELLLSALLLEIQHREKCLEQKIFVPEWKNLSTWINQKCWTQEFPEVIPKINGKEVEYLTYKEMCAKCTPQCPSDKFEIVNTPEGKRWKLKQS